MRLIGSLMVEGRYNELLAVLDVESDTAEPWGENFKRRIEGRVRQHGPLWDEFMQVWQQMGCSPHEEDGHLYIAVRCLQVDHDFYGFFSWVNVENDRIRLILLERFDGTVEEYYRAVEERNERVQDYLDRWDSHVRGKGTQLYSRFTFLPLGGECRSKRAASAASPFFTVRTSPFFTGVSFRLCVTISSD